MVDVLVEHLQVDTRLPGLIEIPCTYLDDMFTTLDFSFGDNTVRIPVRKLISKARNPDSEITCILAIKDSGDERVILGGKSAVEFDYPVELC